ncbi:MAG TPA: alpha-glucuronidase family glycosyl hydrolase [Lacunisphaera sp.]
MFSSSQRLALPVRLCLIWAGLVLSGSLALLRAEDGYELWLRYRPEPDPVLRASIATHMGGGVIAPSRPVLDAARAELARALPVMTGSATLGEGRVFLGGRADHPAIAALVPAADLARVGGEGFVLRVATWESRPAMVVAGNADRGVLQGVFALLRHLQLGRSLAGLDFADAPRVGRRLANHWDNPVRSATFRNESIERGYAGDSIFQWQELPGRIDPRLQDWARLLAAMGLNGVVVNNVNTAKRGLEGWRLLTPEYLPKLAAIADVLRPYGVKLFVSVNFFSPILISRLPTADPLDPAVQAWWRAKADEIYAAIPDFGGLLVKADSEGEPGPMKYGRTHAEGANVIAAALAPHGGEVHWRAFVYDRTSGDRVTQAYTTFMPVDGRFADNVFLQVKNGPLDFQVREPVSPLFGSMQQTNQLLELQITQEYTGQDRHVCFLAPQWHEVLQFDTHARGPGSTVSQLTRDALNPGRRNGLVGVMNTGDARNWTGHLLAQANTYAFGRLAWDPDLAPAQIADEWVRLTFGRDPVVGRTVSRILLDSWRAYEDYTAPIGLGHLTRRGDHLTPDPANRTDYHGGTIHGVGLDRTVATGTGFTGQYHEPWRSRYESVRDCPDDLLLFLHHVPYGHRLHSGRTVIQEIYDRHFAGVERVKGFLREWETLRGRIDQERFDHVHERLAGQIALAEEWCRSVNGYFLQLSGIPDEHARQLP